MNMIRFDSVDSTNTTALDYPVGSVVVASQQVKGRGRFDRSWSSSLGGLWFSLVLGSARRPFEYTFIASLAVLDHVGGCVKWPNDVYVKGKKICGILSEGVSVGSKLDKIIVGVGVNVNNTLPDDLKEIGISLSSVAGKEVDVEELLSKILKSFEKYLSMPFEEVLDLYKTKCCVMGKVVDVKSVDSSLSGKVVDINSNGNLMVEASDGVEKVIEGDVELGILNNSVI